jgi:uncharacterized protein YjbJ (UPF0337 family)
MPDSRELEGRQGVVKREMGKLTDDDLDVIAGKRDQLIGRLQQRYGYSKEEAEKEIDRWQA